MSYPKPPQELIDKWIADRTYTILNGTYLQSNGEKKTDWLSVMEKYGQWCADAELDACCEWEKVHAGTIFSPTTSRVEALRYARRQPISLKQQAINDLELARTVESLPDFDLIRAALDTIPGK